MVLRKPYALLIKHFKLIHLLLVFMMAYLLYKTGMLVNFFSQYISTNNGIILDTVRDTLFNTGMFLLPFAIIVVCLILLSVLVIKKKPFVIYIINIIIFILILAVFNICFSVIGNMSLQIVDSRLIRMARDFSVLSLIAEGVSFLFMLVRAIGFDIKKFNFGQDLQELEISEKDNEEFEVDMSIDTDIMKRNVNKRKRLIRYVYIENRFMIHVALLVIVSVGAYFLYMSSTVYNKKMDPSVYFGTSYFTMRTTNTYLTNTDYRGNKLSEETVLVVVELDIKNRSFTNHALNTANVELHIGSQKYYHDSIYRDKLFDLGHVYENNNISSEFKKELLVFEIPKSMAGNKMELKYIDEYATKGNSLRPKYITVPLSPVDIDSNPKTEVVDISQGVHFGDSIFKDTLFTINRYEIAPKFRLSYSFCISQAECYESREYITPVLNSNTDKVLLKIVGTLRMDESLNVRGIYNLFNFMQYFGTLQYETAGTVKSISPFTRVIPSKAKEANTYFVEIPKEAMSAEKLSILLRVRNRNYQYVLK